MQADTKSGVAEDARPSRKPADTAVTQQRLPACKPVLDPCWIIFIFVSIGIILIPIGAICFAYGIQPYEERLRYDKICFQNPDSFKSNAARRQEIIRGEVANDVKAYSCQLNIKLKKTMEPPIFVYYELDGFYQNHRRYVKSRSEAQLAGLTTKPDTDCKPQQFLNKNGSQPILPCGLVAWSFFNDTFSLNSAGRSVDISNDSLASKTDRRRFVDTKATFFNVDLENGRFRGGATLKVNISQDDRFILWMKTAALPTFRKLWGRIETKLEANTIISFDIVNRYNTFEFNGKKAVVIGTTTWLGGSSRFLGLAYLITGGTSWVLGAFYAILLPFMGRKIGQIDQITWPSTGD